MATNKHTNVGNAAARNQYAAAGQVQDGSFVYAGTVGGTADVITITLSPAITAYAAGQCFRFIASGANTTNVTVNVNSVGVKAVNKRGGTALVAGDIPASSIVEIVYDGTDFELTNIQPDAALFPLLASANTFTADQTISDTDAGAGVGPTLTLHRNSASPAASDAIGEVVFDGDDDGDNQTTYAKVYGQIDDPTNASEDGRMVFQTVVAGTLADRGYIANGAVLGSATGGDQGAGTINATAIYDDGVQLVASPLVLIETQNITSGVSTIDFETGIDGTYETYVFEISGLQVDTDQSKVKIRVGTGGTPTYQSTNYFFGVTGLRSQSGALSNHTGGSSEDDIEIMSVDGGTASELLGNAAGEHLSGTVKMFQPASTAHYTSFHFDGMWHRAADGEPTSFDGQGSWQDTTAVTAVRFMLDAAGNFDDGRITLYGINHS